MHPWMPSCRHCQATLPLVVTEHRRPKEPELRRGSQKTTTCPWNRFADTAAMTVLTPHTQRRHLSGHRAQIAASCQHHSTHARALQGRMLRIKLCVRTLVEAIVSGLRNAGYLCHGTPCGVGGCHVEDSVPQRIGDLACTCFGTWYGSDPEFIPTFSPWT